MTIARHGAITESGPAMLLTLYQLPGEFAIARLAPELPVPSWAEAPSFCSITRTAHELSILCPATQVPTGVRCEQGWVALSLEGPFAFTLTGVLLAVLAPLAAAEVGILAVSTFDTDVVLVQQSKLGAAVAALEAAGHRVIQSS